MKIFVIGHLSPDLDTVAAAYGYAQYLTALKAYPDAEIIPLVTEEPNLETKTIFERFEVALPEQIKNVQITPEDRFILVDHNEHSQRHALITNDAVIEIVDHHKINVTFTNPIKLDVRPVASTCTIIHLLYKSHSIVPPMQVEQLIAASILSDTGGLISPTTTGTDIAIAHEIANNYRLDLEELTFVIFKAKSDMSNMSIMEIIKKDYKVFDFDGNKVFIGTVETVEPELIIAKKEQIVSGLIDLKKELGVSFAFLCVTDLVKANTQVIFESDTEGKVLENAFATVSADALANIGPRISRKKEIAPGIEKALTTTSIV